MRQVQRLKPHTVYEIINSTQHYPVNNMCKIAKVSKSGYYKWLKTKDIIKPQEILDNVLIKEIFNKKKEKIWNTQDKNGIRKNRSSNE